MAIKISGNTIIDDSRVVTNAERVGIGITPRYDLEVLSDTLPTGIAASVTNAQTDDVNKGLLVFNKNVAAPTFTVSYRGRVDALEYSKVVLILALQLIRQIKLIFKQIPVMYHNT